SASTALRARSNSPLQCCAALLAATATAAAAAAASAKTTNLALSQRGAVHGQRPWMGTPGDVEEALEAGSSGSMTHWFSSWSRGCINGGRRNNGRRTALP